MKKVNISTEDRLLVQDLLCRYALAVDLENPTAFGETFHEDAVYGINFKDNAAMGITVDRWRGRQVITDFIVNDFFKTGGLRKFMHLNTNFVISEATESRCKVISYSILIERASDDERPVRFMGLYNDTCVKVDGQWYFEERFFTEYEPDDKQKFWI